MTVTVVVARMVLNLDQERGAWVIYSNLHILTLGGIPANADMREFAPLLWEEHARIPAMRYMYNDAGLSADAVAVDDTPQQRMRRAELWQEAETRIVARVHERDRDRFDTSGFSCRGIVPRSPAAEF